MRRIDLLWRVSCCGPGLPVVPVTLDRARPVPLDLRAESASESQSFLDRRSLPFAHLGQARPSNARVLAHARRGGSGDSDLEVQVVAVSEWLPARGYTRRCRG